MTSAQNVKAKVAAHKNASRHGVSKKGLLSHKIELLTDFEDDFDECDDHNSSGKDKFYITNTLFNSSQLTTDYSSKTLCDNIYYHVNFSRLPRYNYISLRVLRI